MSNQQVNKVDLSLDEIIKLNKKEQKQDRSGSNGSKNRMQGNTVQRRNQNRGGGRRGAGVSPLNRKQGTGGGTIVFRRGQRGNLRGWAGRNSSMMRRGGSGGSRGGSAQRNLAGGSSGVRQNATTFRGSFRGTSRGGMRDNLQAAMDLAAQAGFEPQDIMNKLNSGLEKHRRAQLQSENRNLSARKVVLDRRYDRQRLFCESDDLMIVYDCKQRCMLDWFIRKDRKDATHFEEDAQTCVKNWPRASGEKFEPFCELLSINVSILAAAIRQYLGARGSMRGVQRGGRNYNNVNQGTAMQGFRNQGQGQGQGQMKRMSLKQKRVKAMQALKNARKTISQLDQQQARDNFVNARRGILHQTPTLQTANKQQAMYSSSSSLASVGSFRSSSASSGRTLQGTQVTAFTSPAPAPRPQPQQQQQQQRRRRWRQSRSPAPGLSNSASTLTISFDNIPAQTSSFASPQVTTAPPRQRQQRRRQWRRNRNNNGSNNNNTTNNNYSDFSSSAESRSGSSVDDVDSDMNRGASSSFSQQLSKLKPTVSTNYVFQKKTFATGNTSYSLNDRFSRPPADDTAGRKVYM